ncbi:MAG: M20 family metallopeptidase [Candidatus Peregrinibacteria bacterium]|nr:M20 family metallopeptidase [Candidatus Peregrinibacteria bacterium]
MERKLIEWLRTFIAFPTVQDNAPAKRECLQWIGETFLAEWEGERMEGDIGGAPYLYLRHPSPEFLWFAHIDVVPGNPEQFILQVDGDRAYGRGTKDMKGASLPFLCALRSVLAEGKRPAVSVLLTSDEEVGGASIAGLVEGGVTAPIACTPDSGNNPAIIVEHKGSAWAKLIVEGKDAHASWPWTGENPIPLLAHAIEVLTDAFPVPLQEEWGMTVTPTQLSASDAVNKIPDRAVASLDIRFPYDVCTQVDQALELVRAALPEGCTLELVRGAAPLRTAPDHPRILALKRLIHEVTGEEIPIGREHGASDARHFSKHGIPAFIYGPVGGGIHSKEEWISLTSLVHYCEIERRLLLAV